MVKKIKSKDSWFIKYKFHILVGFIFLIAIFLRFYNIDTRWGLGNDSARDIAIAIQALKHLEFPVSGPFSSAGPFVFGPVYYWLLMFSNIIFPFTFLAPVIFTALMGLAAVGILMACGYLLEGRKLALIVGALAATSPQLVIRSSVVGQQSFIPVATALLFLMYILFWQKKKFSYAFIMGIALACALSFHYQVINLLLFFPALLFVPGLPLLRKMFAMLIMFLGFVIPTFPFFIWDLQQNFANLNNILDYLLVGQYRIYVPNSWRLFIFDYLPTYWAMVTAGFNLKASLIVMFFTFGSLIFYTLKRQISGILFVLSIIFYILLFVNRYYKGERSEGYLVYFVPFIILFTSWFIYKLFNIERNKMLQKFGFVLGTLFLFLIFSVNFISAKDYLKSENSLREINETIVTLEKEFPNKKFAIYDYQARYTSISQPLALILGAQGKTSPDGVPIGVTCGSENCVCIDLQCKKKMKQISMLINQRIVYLHGIDTKDRNKWVRLNQEDMYDNLIGWSKRHELKSTFNLQNYIGEKIK